MYHENIKYLYHEINKVMQLVALIKFAVSVRLFMILTRDMDVRMVKAVHNLVQSTL